MALRVGTIHKAFETIEGRFGGGRIQGRFVQSELTEPRASAVFLQLTTESGGSDFGPLFGQPIAGKPGADPARYHPDPKLNLVIEELAQSWREAKAAAAGERAGALAEFVAGDWHSDPQFPAKFATAVAQRKDTPTLRAYTMRYFGHKSVPESERPRVGGPRALRQLRALFVNAQRLKERGGLVAVLRDQAGAYAQGHGGDAKKAREAFPRIAFGDGTDASPSDFARFLERGLASSFDDVSPNLASYALRDLARRGGGQLLKGTEHAFVADRNTAIFLTRAGLVDDVAAGKQLTVMPEAELREVHLKAFDLMQTEFIQTNAELSERMAIAARERLV
ncbi:MAG TPA: hypothetical protein VGB42_00720 [Candidatus Thermoplasmatota archaeon]